MPNKYVKFRRNVSLKSQKAASNPYYFRLTASYSRLFSSTSRSACRGDSSSNNHIDRHSSKWPLAVFFFLLSESIEVELTQREKLYLHSTNSGGTAQSSLVVCHMCYLQMVQRHAIGSRIILARPISERPMLPMAHKNRRPAKERATG